MPTEYDAGKLSLDALIEWVDAHAQGAARNEATTRLHLIDQFLVEVLRWPRSSITTEDPAGAGRIDYALGAPALQLIIEAKREGEDFSLPVGIRTGVHSIASLTDGASGRPLLKAMTQVSEYAARRGVGIAGVTNGNQYVFFIAVRADGIAPLTGRALVFPSLVDIRSDFRLLWDNVSPVGVDSRTLHSTLRLGAATPPEPLSAHLLDYPGVKRRNDLQAGLEILGELFLLDVTKMEGLRRDFLRDCYASSGALSQYAEVSRQILQTRYALLKSEGGPDSVPVMDRRGVAPVLTQDTLAAAASKRPIVLLGDVGVGKTTFIQRLVNVDAEEVFEEACTLYIDFGGSTTLGSLQEFVVRESIRQLFNLYDVDVDDAAFVESVYHGRLNRFDKGVVGRLRDVDERAYLKERILFLQRLVDDRPRHLEASLNFLHQNRRKQIVIFLDNIDQRSGEDQEQVFLIANELALTWPATVFVTLRPETFYRSSRSGALSGYQPRVFTIAPPRADVMLQRRVDFVLRQIRETGRPGSYPVGVTVESESLIDFFEMLAQNFRENDQLLALIDNISGGNMRMALELVTSFIGSGHIDTNKILEIQRSSGYYRVPVHEFLRAILFGDHVYYDPDSSPVANLFHVTQPDGREHFLIPLLLAHVQAQGERVGQDGFVTADDVFAFGQDLGFMPEQIRAALDHSVGKRLLDSSPRYTADRARQHYRVTTVGAYSVRVLVALFAYADAVVVDTPIVDDAYRRLITDIHTLSERVNRAEYFRLYLDRQWSLLTDVGLPWRWPQVSDRLSEDIRRVGRRADPDAWSWSR